MKYLLQGKHPYDSSWQTYPCTVLAERDTYQDAVKQLDFLLNSANISDIERSAVKNSFRKSEKHKRMESSDGDDSEHDNAGDSHSLPAFPILKRPRDQLMGYTGDYNGCFC
jgi:hypothetical protein